ncbi:protection of telomeres protein 1a-like isoform X3 [Magnolia sinica]|uniref:protection of telomeres protein 1a-like isoform X3 n=1 Tax=Magnolia sinica TaxID=86752 RepID=UPI00265A0507|nr:protection of telomeres protein 1a-like isoform X3 [Magnolia sinica]
MSSCNLLSAWHGVKIGKSRMRIWRLAILAIWWSVWEERNDRCFNGRSASVQAVWSRAKYLLLEWEHGLSVNIFTEDMTMLPRVRSLGDIIALHNVLMKDHKGNAQALFNKKCSSFALFEGKSCMGFIPYQIYSNFHITDQDEVLVTQIRTWLAHYKFDAGMNEYSLQLRDIKVGKYFDLVCKILHMSVVVDDVSILYVWDGTDAPPTEIQMNLDDEARIPLPLQSEQSPLSRDVLCTFPCVGTVLRFTVGKFFEDIGLQLQGRGQWVKFRNITCQLQSGLWKGVLLPTSKIRLLSDKDSAVKHCERGYVERLSTGVDHLPRPSSITEMGYGHVGFSSLMEVLTFTKVTQKFKCVVRFVAIYPWQPEDFRSPETGLYRIRFTLEDPTARIHAYLYGEDGMTEVKLSLLEQLKQCTSDAQVDAQMLPIYMSECLRASEPGALNDCDTTADTIYISFFV